MCPQITKSASTFRRVPFDYEKVFEEFERSGFNKECGPIGRLILEIYKRARPTFGFLKWREVYKSDLPISNELIDEYLANSNWHEFAHPAYHVNME